MRPNKVDNCQRFNNTFFLGYFSYTGGTHAVRLDTPWVSISADDVLPLCLTFNYSMRSQFGSSLNVSYRWALNESEVLLYNLFGYHGERWFKGQVSWKAKGDSKVPISSLFIN